MGAMDDALRQSLQKAAKEAFDLDLQPNEIIIEIPKRKEQGEYSTNLAMKLARTLHQKPALIAQSLVDHLPTEAIESAQIAGPGFINFVMKKDQYSKIIPTILDKQNEYGTLEPNGIKVDLEYVSANPTGSLHLGHARGAAWGDSIARIMKKGGYDVTREYYVNDAGNQITNLAKSLWARYVQAHGGEAEIGQDGYMGADVKQKAEQLAKDYPNQYLEPTDETLDFFRKEGIAFELDKIKEDLDRFRVHFDVWSSEQALRDSGRVDEALAILDQNGYTYTQDGALWFRTTDFKDDKDRVLRKQDGSLTYLVPDIAYHNDKYQRGFDLLVDFFGADHHGYIPRLKASMAALGNDPDKLNVDIIQMVRLVSNGEEVKMSKRLGNATTINDLVDLVGVDAARYFFSARALDSHLDFDLALAVSQTNENPVYYAQYAHARICSILRNADYPEPENYEGLVHEKEIELLKTLAEYPSVIEQTARTRQVHKISHYIQNLASKFHSFYSACKVNDPDNPELSAQRIGLLKAVRIVLADALSLIGVNAPESM
ncbi:arginine--tRNA ligase [Erysipelotrichaceae bacterium RD49]|nr:arginine--tRNA ligase [Erysipelotrichaceae bacterium RD49]